MNSTLKGYVNASYLQSYNTYNTCDDKVEKDYIMIILFILELLVAFGVITAHKKYVKNRQSGNTVIHEEKDEEEEWGEEEKRIHTM